jgi:hypothetical protein
MSAEMPTVKDRLLKASPKEGAGNKNGNSLTHYGLG